MSIITQTEMQDMAARSLKPFKQDIVGTNTISISVGVEVPFVVNGLSRNFSEGPAYFTDRYDPVTNTMKAITEYGRPVYSADVGFRWTPDASNEGVALVRIYINDASPKLIKTYRLLYKGASTTPEVVNTDWYWGDDPGYDAKNDGIYFTIEFEHAGTITYPSLLFYNTQ